MNPAGLVLSMCLGESLQLYLLNPLSSQAIQAKERLLECYSYYLLVQLNEALHLDCSQLTATLADLFPQKHHCLQVPAQQVHNFPPVHLKQLLLHCYLAHSTYNKHNMMFIESLFLSCFIYFFIQYLISKEARVLLFLMKLAIMCAEFQLILLFRRSK